MEMVRASTSSASASALRLNHSTATRSARWANASSAAAASSRSAFSSPLSPSSAPTPVLKYDTVFTVPSSPTTVASAIMPSVTAATVSSPCSSGAVSAVLAQIHQPRVTIELVTKTASTVRPKNCRVRKYRDMPVPRAPSSSDVALRLYGCFVSPRRGACSAECLRASTTSRPYGCGCVGAMAADAPPLSRPRGWGRAGLV
mmetsp:Transcript_4034/g.14106  ORF Transcript_4034/g.14106 Transcript_4034/m.14106 type:complete len:201 (+) Transcript_4034:2439-3041(+)